MKFKIKVRKYIAVVLSFCLVLSAGVAVSYAAEADAILTEAEIAEDFVSESAATAEEPPVDSLETPIEEQAAQEENGQENLDAAAERQAQGLGFVPGEILVVFDGQAQQSSMQSTASEADGAIRQAATLASGDTVAVVDISLLQTVAQAIEAFSQMPDVKYAQPNYTYTLFESDTSPSSQDPLRSEQWYLDKMNVALAHTIVGGMQKQQPQREKVRVAVLDTAVDLNHEDLQGSLNKELCVDASQERITPYPKTPGAYDHGTHVAGIIAADTGNGKGIDGMASPEGASIIDLVSVSIFDGPEETSMGVAVALDYAIGIGADVINMSFGRESELPYPHDRMIERDLCDVAYKNGIILIAAAGNSNTDDPSYPSDYRSVISIIANKNWTEKNDTRADFSNFGAEKDFSAPGVGIVSAVPYSEYDIKDGTSMAAPAVTGVVAMMKYIDPTLNMDTAYEILKQTVSGPYPGFFDAICGWGEISAGKALEKVYIDYVLSQKPKTPIVKAESLSYNSIKLYWEPIKDPDGGVTEYTVYKNNTRLPNNDLAYKPIAVVSDPNFVDKNMVPGKAVSYRVSCKVSGIEGSMSKTVKITPVCAAPKNLKAASTTASSATLTWEKVSGAKGYYVYRSESKNGQYKYVTKVSANSFKDTGLASKSKYYYKVFSYNMDEYGSILKGKTAGPVLAATK